MPETAIIPWKRFWCRFGDAIHVGDYQQGFLTDPEDRFLKPYNSNLFTTNELLSIPCVVLCGDPGIGKSTEILRAKDALQQSLRPGDHLIWVECRDVPNESVFSRRTTDSAAWKTWQTSSQRMHLVIDGVDEGLIKIQDFVAYLKSQLANEPIQRLHLILVCRSAEWPITLGAELMSLWAIPERPPLFELCPLRRRDVEMAALAHGVNSERFMEAVFENSVVGLAARPTSLFFLLGEFKARGSFSGTHKDLYERGCRRLTQEHDQRRIESLRVLRRTARVFTAEEIYFACTQIAGLLLLSGKSAIQTMPSGENPDDLKIEDLVSETASPSPIGVTEDLILDALGTGLFTSRGPNRFGFAHLTFAECLASEFLARLPLVQIRTLLCGKDGGLEYIIPQLAETAAWVAGRRNDFFDFILLHEPEALLRSDVSKVQSARKADLVSGILDRAARADLFDETKNRRFYSALQHPGLAQQLRVYINDHSANTVVRGLAMEIAAECKVSDLTDDLMAIIRDATSNQHIRERAARALEELIPDARVTELIPLAGSEVGPDPDDTIKGFALRRLCNTIWSVSKALPLIHSPRNRKLFGSYKSLIQHQLPRHLTESDLPQVLGRMIRWTQCFDFLSPFKELAEKAFSESLKLLTVPRIRRLAVRVWRVKARRSHPLPHNRESSVVCLFEAHEEIRRSFVEAIINDPDSAEEDVWGLQGHFLNILLARDLAWALEKLAGVDQSRRAYWACAIVALAQPETACPCWDALLDRIETFPELKSKFLWLRAWHLDEAEALQAKGQWLEGRSRQEGLRRRRKVPDVGKLIEKNLMDIEQGRTSLWIELCAHLSLEPGHTHYTLPLGIDIKDYSGWKSADENTRTRIRNAARQYLLQNNDGYAEIGSRTNFSDPGCTAICLLDDEIQQDAQLRGAVAQHWIEAMIGRFNNGGEHYQKMASIAFALDPEATIRCFIREIKDDDRQHGQVLCLHGFKGVWNDSFTRAALGLVQTGEVKPGSIESILRFVASMAPETTAQCAREALANSPIHDAAGRDQAILIVSFCLGKVPNLTWETFWPLIEGDRAFAEAVLLRVADRIDYDRNQMMPLLSEEQLAELYLKVREIFPPEMDPEFHGGVVPPRQSIVYFRNDLIGALEGRGSEECCRQLLRLADSIPEESLWFRWRWYNARTAKRQKQWIAPSPAVVLELVRRGEARLVRDCDDLVSVVVESLERLENKLVRSALPRAEDLWRWEGAEHGRHNHSPKDEAFLSDYVASWLRDDIVGRGIIVAREVQPRLGQRTDIHVSALPVPQGTRQLDALTVVIELKGCWHRQVRTALEQQLVADYLRPNGLTHGIYVVGWFVCGKWKEPKNYLQSGTIDFARAEIAIMASKFDGVSTPEKVRAFILDCRYPS